MASPPLEIPLKTWDEIGAFFAHELDTMTLLVPSPAPPAVGTVLQLNLRGPTGDALPLRVRVTQHVGGERPGARVQFVPLSQDERQGLADWLAESRYGTPQAPPPPKPKPKAPPLKSALIADPDQAAQIEQALSQQLARFKKLDGYTILGLDSSAGGAQVKAAYDKLVKSYHPHHFARYGPRVGKLATQVFVHVQRAHREAVEIVKTRAYDNDAGARRGRSGPRAGRTLEAQAISQALQLLGLSQFDAAKGVLDKALARTPDNDNLRLHRHLVEARAHRARDNAAGAIQAYRAILAINPRHDEARVELELLEQTEEAPRGGLFKRFKGAR